MCCSTCLHTVSVSCPGSYLPLQPCRYDTVAKTGIASAKQHLQTSFPDGIALESTFVSPAVVHQLDAAAEDAVSSGSWCDMQALLPSALSQDDAVALLEHCPFMQSTG